MLADEINTVGEAEKICHLLELTLTTQSCIVDTNVTLTPELAKDGGVAVAMAVVNDVFFLGSTVTLPRFPHA